MTKKEWVPGDPLYPHPYERAFNQEHDPQTVEDFDRVGGHAGNYTRRMIEIINEMDAETRLDIERSRGRSVCTRCLVYWKPKTSNDIRCFICDKPTIEPDDE